MSLKFGSWVVHEDLNEDNESSRSIELQEISLSKSASLIANLKKSMQMVKPSNMTPLAEENYVKYY
jgi:hypothetical protein